jgi:aspartyl-tRNA(Asn)/glutamyl-tRNA(Gln) amidotransferase subunit B
MEYEQKRQAQILDDGGVIEQETRRWDDVRGISTPMRSKEDAQDYRYFPEPDLVPIVVSDEWVEEIRKTIPELPEQRKARYVGEYALPEYDAFILTSSKKMADFFDAAVADGAKPKAVSNWLMGDISKILNEKELEPADIPFTPSQLAKMITLIDKGTISNSAAKKVLDAMFSEPDDPEKLVEKLGLAQVSDEGAILDMINDVLAQNPQSVADYKAGKDRAMGFLVGQVMRVSKGKANPQVINKLLKEALDNA